MEGLWSQRKCLNLSGIWTYLIWTFLKKKTFFLARTGWRLELIQHLNFIRFELIQRKSVSLARTWWRLELIQHLNFIWFELIQRKSVFLARTWWRLELIQHLNVIRFELIQRKSIFLAGTWWRLEFIQHLTLSDLNLPGLDWGFFLCFFFPQGCSVLTYSRTGCVCWLLLAAVRNPSTPVEDESWPFWKPWPYCGCPWELTWKSRVSSHVGLGGKTHWEFTQTMSEKGWNL